ncbi:GDSL-type esterase/lipase family protein [Dactylosporangium sp. NPDC048998]|uniref:GDSL-type esterase/lipase family protein n=1 Tax=Dactylosporangium sp. NPDC048998 TaxID=3363976 RepID=UPI0037241CF6
MSTRKLASAAIAAALAIVAAGIWRPAFGDAVKASGNPTSAAAPAWTGTWAAAPQSSGTTFNQQTIRQIVHTSIGGTAARIRLSNAFGSQPVTIADVHLARRTSGASIDPASDRAVTFGGAPQTTIPVGGSVTSDQVAFAVDALADVAVSFYLPSATGNATVHDFGDQTNYVTAGDVAGSATLSGAQTRSNYFFLTNLDVQNAAAEGAVVALGASITDGVGSGANANRRWPDDLAVRLGRAGRTIGVLNQGISGNRLLADGAGQSAANRFDRDVLSQPNVKWVVFSDDPINDLGNSGGSVTGDQLVTAAKQLIARAHQAGVKFLCSTLTPFQGAGYWTQAGENGRQAYNAFVRGAGSGCDGVVDQDTATHDPARPTWFRSDLETGDHLHPNEAGLQAIADAVGLSLFGTATPPPATVVSFRAHANGKLVTAENAGNDPLIANRTAVGPWEQFDRIDLGNGRIALRAHANGKLVTAENAGAAPLVANRTDVGAWETFDLIRNPDGSVSLRATVNGRYVCADNAGAAPLIANRTAIGAWESFDLL